jgi:hypothetical protein
MDAISKKFPYVGDGADDLWTETRVKRHGDDVYPQAVEDLMGELGIAGTVEFLRRQGANQGQRGGVEAVN